MVAYTLGSWKVQDRGAECLLVLCNSFMLIKHMLENCRESQHN